MDTDNNISFNLTFDDIFSDNLTQASVLNKKIVQTGLDVPVKTANIPRQGRRVQNIEQLVIVRYYNTTFSPASIKNTENNKLTVKVEKCNTAVTEVYKQVNVVLTDINVIKYNATTAYKTKNNINKCAADAVKAYETANIHKQTAKQQNDESEKIVATMKSDSESELNLKLIAQYNASEINKTYLDVKKVAGDIYTIASQIINLLHDSDKKKYMLELTALNPDNSD